MRVSLERVKSFFGNKTVRVVLIAAAALLLLIAVYRVFFAKPSSGYAPTEQEERLMQLLNRVEGVDETSVMITEENGAVVGVVVMFEGKDGFLTRMRLAKIAASALNIGESAVVVYPAEK